MNNINSCLHIRMKHIADEEAYMESIHYNKLFTQKVQHQAFIEKLDEFMESHNK